jgi:hypothetical protein
MSSTVLTAEEVPHAPMPAEAWTMPWPPHQDAPDNEWTPALLLAAALIDAMPKVKASPRPDPFKRDVLLAADIEDALRVSGDLESNGAALILANESRAKDGLRIGSVTVTRMAVQSNGFAMQIEQLRRSWLLCNPGAGPFTFTVIW